ncbi:MAG: uroporphyrinogen decarboxylase family protein [Phycisphaeraceae bacterium]
MSRELGLAVLREDYDEPRIAVMEHFTSLSREVVIGLTGRDPLTEGPDAINAIYQQVGRELEIDLNWGGGLPDRGGERFDWSDGATTKMNRQGQTCVQWGIFSTTHAEDGRHFHHIPKPAGVAEALAFDPAPYFPQSVAELTQRFTQEYAQMLRLCGDVCYPIPHHYTTAFHFPLAIFGFELLCETGMADEDALSKLMERFAEISLRITTAWSRVPGIAGFICHDDLTMTSGPIFPPAWYRRHIFPHYRQIFAPLRTAGIPIIFCSDGDCTEFIDDVVDAGADGINIEHWVALEPVVQRYPDMIIVGNLSSDVMAHGSPQQIIEHTTRCMAAGAAARRFVVNVGGGLTHDIPLENLRVYLETRKELARTMRGSTHSLSGRSPRLG